VGALPDLAVRIERLVAAGARVTFITDAELDAVQPAEVAALAARDALHAFHARRAVDADLAGKAIVFVAPWTTPEDEARARRWHEAARTNGTLVSTVDRPETSTFISAAVLRVPGLAMTFGSGGRAPAVLRRIREDLEALFSDPRFAAFVDELASLRASLPRGERAGPVVEAVTGFAVDARLRFPAWFVAAHPVAGEPTPGAPSGDAP
jgi:precorrin-2 dehydrogenase/sirohydrochlorin ferrochelatase